MDRCKSPVVYTWDCSPLDILHARAGYNSYSARLHGCGHHSLSRPFSLRLWTSEGSAAAAAEENDFVRALPR